MLILWCQWRQLTGWLLATNCDFLERSENNVRGRSPCVWVETAPCPSHFSLAPGLIAFLMLFCWQCFVEDQNWHLYCALGEKSGKWENTETSTQSTQTWVQVSLFNYSLMWETKTEISAMSSKAVYTLFWWDDIPLLPQTSEYKTDLAPDLFMGSPQSSPAHE